MTRKDKARVLRDLTTSVLGDMLAKVPSMPEEWDGHELRAYVAECFADVEMGTLTGKRRRRYRNAVLVFNLRPR